MAYACGHKDLSYFIKLIQRNNNIDMYMDVDRTKQLKIIDKIGVPDFRMTITNTIELVYDEPNIIYGVKKTKKNKRNRRK